jgi:ligand-binding sensor domain-containing protein
LVKASLSFIAEDKAGNVWIVSDYGKNVGDTLGGLWYSRPSVANPKEKTFTKITNKEVYFIFEDRDNNIWFSTRGMGLYRNDRKTLVEFSREKK